jgi:hypothetical protein
VSNVVIVAFHISILVVSTSCTFQIFIIPSKLLDGVIVRVVETPAVTVAYIVNHQLALTVSVLELTLQVKFHSVRPLTLIATLTLLESVEVNVVVSVPVFPVSCSAQLSVIVHQVQAVHPALSLRCVFVSNSLAGLNNQS